MALWHKFNKISLEKKKKKKKKKKLYFEYKFQTDTLSLSNPDSGISGIHYKEIQTYTNSNYM